MISNQYKEHLNTLTTVELCYELIFWQNKKRLIKDENIQKMCKCLIGYIQDLLDQRYKIND